MILSARTDVIVRNGPMDEDVGNSQGDVDFSQLLLAAQA